MERVDETGGGLSQKLFFVTLVVATFFFGVCQSIPPCISVGNNLKCFECNSHENALCSDPFNWTTLPPLKQCDGCCVKMVQGIGMPDYKVVRGCTSDIEINMFMVDHVCMAEGGGKGKMCFCEEHQCNKASLTTTTTTTTTLLIVIFGSLLLSYNLT